MPSSPPGEPKFWPRTPPDFLLLSHGPERNVKISRSGLGKQLAPFDFPLSRHLPAPRHPFPLLQPPTHTSVAHFYPLKKKNSDDVSLRKALGLHLLMWNHPWETRAPRVTVTSRRIGQRSRLPALRPSLLARVSAASARERRPSLGARGRGSLLRLSRLGLADPWARSCRGAFETRAGILRDSGCISQLCLHSGEMQGLWG